MSTHTVLLVWFIETQLALAIFLFVVIMEIYDRD